MARNSLIATMTLFLPGCIVAEPPTYQPSQQTKPFLDLVKAVPKVEVLYERQTNDVVKFSVPIRSEDKEPLFAALHRDYGSVKPEVGFLQVISEIPASTFENTRREIKFEWTINADVPRGCHSVSLVVVHRSNFDFLNWGPRTTQLMIEDGAIATWWFFIQPHPLDISGCPRPESSGNPPQ